MEKVTVKDIIYSFIERANRHIIKDEKCTIGYDITGDQGGKWTVIIDMGDVKVEEGMVEPDVVISMKDEDFIGFTLGRLDALNLLSSGRLKIDGDVSIAQKSAKFFKKFTLDKKEEVEELIRLKQILSIPQRFSTGEVMGYFLHKLKEKKIMANKCPKCGRLQCPPREVCAICRVAADEWVEVGPEGILTVADIIYYAAPDPLTGEIRKTPYISAYIILDGCEDPDTFWHEIDPSTPHEKLKKGARVRPVWNDVRIGAITDIKYFEVL
ncbi:hypothetical protein JCM13304A_13980 [Desulfothermus okinawensis JCM 13304]